MEVYMERSGHYANHRVIATDRGLKKAYAYIRRTYGDIETCRMIHGDRWAIYFYAERN